MDIASRFKNVASFIITLVVALVIVQPSQATPSTQSGNCPPGYLSLPAPHGTYPGTALFCVPSGGTQQLVSAPEIACDQGIKMENGFATMDEHEILTFVPPVSLEIPTGSIDYKFALTLDYALPISPFGDPSVQIAVWTYDETGTFLDSGGFGMVNQGSYWRVTGEIKREQLTANKIVYWFYTEAPPGTLPFVPHGGPSVVHNLPARQPDMVQGGMMQFHVILPEPYMLDKYYFSSVAYTDSAYKLYEIPTCKDEPEWNEAPPTPTPSVTPPNTNTPTHTPTGTIQPTSTPILPPSTATTGPTATPPPSGTPTPLATAYIANTSTPHPTSTPPPQSTRYVPVPTGIPPIDMPPIALPSIVLNPISIPLVQPAPIGTLSPYGVLTPNATSQAAGDGFATRAADTYIMVTRWHTVTTGALETITLGNTGITTTAATADLLVENLTLPIRYVKTVKYILPSLWVFVLFLITVVAWITFVTVAEFVINNGGKIIEIIRRIYEAIPFVG